MPDKKNNFEHAMLYTVSTYVDKFLAYVRPIIWVWIVRVHVFDGIENSLWIQRVVVLVDVVVDHRVEEVPADVVIGGQRLVVIWKKKEKQNNQSTKLFLDFSVPSQN